MISWGESPPWRFVAVHPDGTIFKVENTSNAPNYWVIGIDPILGRVKFRVPLDTPDCVYDGARDLQIAGDGYAYATYECAQTYPDLRGYRAMLLRVDTNGVYDKITIKEMPYLPGYNGEGWYAGVGGP